MRATLLLLLCATAALPARAQPPPSPAAVVAAMPRDLPFWRRDGAVTDFEARPGTAGYGASVRYAGQRDLRAVGTVYVYDRGAPRQPEGTAAPAVAAELASAAAEMRQIAATGRYTLLAEPVTMAAGPAGPGGAACLLVPLRHQDGETTRDAVCVTIHQRRFLKTRVTLYDDTDPRRAGIIAYGLMAETSPDLLPQGGPGQRPKR